MQKQKLDVSLCGGVSFQTNDLFPKSSDIFSLIKYNLINTV